ncbi:MAG: hypothetical protein HY711_11095 [Candidatus Melainabacteria bacterium]|nr:hypothetical protein [Candidatus Melainabacteria bacterium]
MAWNKLVHSTGRHAGTRFRGDPEVNAGVFQRKPTPFQGVGLTLKPRATVFLRSFPIVFETGYGHLPTAVGFLPIYPAALRT